MKGQSRAKYRGEHRRGKDLQGAESGPTQGAHPPCRSEGPSVCCPSPPPLQLEGTISLFQNGYGPVRAVSPTPAFPRGRG